MCQKNKCCKQCNKNKVNFSLQSNYQSAKTGGLVDNIFTAATVGLNFLNAQQQANAAGNAQSGQIVVAGQQIIEQLNQVVSAAQTIELTEANLKALHTTAYQLSQALNQLPVSKSSDKFAVGALKQQATQIVAQMQSILRDRQTQQPVITGNSTVNSGTSTPAINSNGQVIYAPTQTGGLFGNLDEQSKQILLYGGLGLLAYLLIKK